MPKSLETVAESIKRSLRRLTIATVILYLVSAFFTGITYSAMCALDHDLERRVSDSREFLRQHPQGIPGIPASAIRVSVKSQEETIDTLGVLHCL